MLESTLKEKQMNTNQCMMIVRGLPGSGKSTFAKRWVAQDPENRVRISRDDIRYMLFGKYYGLTISQESTVTKVEWGNIKSALSARQSVIIDNQNLKDAYVYPYLKIALEHKVAVLHKDFKVDIDVVLAQNKLRPADRIVPEEAILKFQRRYFKDGKFPEFPVLAENFDEAYIPDETLPKAIILDVDGTGMIMSPNRGPYDFHLVLDDTPNPAVVFTVQALKAQGVKVVVVSGRDDSCKEDTLLSLAVAGIEVDEIHMRVTGDRRKDYIIKKEIFDAHIRYKYNVLLALDDRNSVVDAYRKDLKLPVFQVNYGDF